MPWKLSEGVSISGGIVLPVDCHVLRIEGGEDADAHTEVAVRAGDRHSKKLPERPDNKTLLRIYLLYKQATEGDITAKRPGLTDLVGRAKRDALKAVEGKSSNEGPYVDLIESLK
ncbi:MAG: acyl-CoA-binding protein [Rhodomicrobium sp.]|jgi:diazepam-binding inhibitor (GABA receptor modulator, acyl-CoA-binding protein)